MIILYVARYELLEQIKTSIHKYTMQYFRPLIFILITSSDANKKHTNPYLRSNGVTKREEPKHVFLIINLKRFQYTI